MKSVVLFFLLLSSPHAGAQDTISLYFETGRAGLTHKSKKTIDSSLYHSSLPLNSTVQIYGYADSVGSSATNKQLSEQRALNVRQYLVEHGIDPTLVSTTTGMGEAGNYQLLDLNRRVDIVRGGNTQPPAVGQAVTSRLKKGTTLVLDNLYFYVGSNRFKPESAEALEGLYQWMHQNPTLRIMLEGHACCYFKKDKNVDTAFLMQLSSSRAQAVLDFLVSKGIERRRLNYIGWGGKKPRVRPERTKEDEQKNMRVEVRILDI